MGIQLETPPPVYAAERICPVCRLPFVPAPEATGRNRYRCKPCNAAAAVVYRNKYPRAVAEREKIRAANPRRARAVAKSCRKNKLARYGITPEQYDAMVEKQGAVCAICEKPESSAASMTNPHIGGRAVRKLAVDHDHKTRKVRGLLCSNCNRAIGFLKESPALARKLASYLEVNK